MSFSGKPLTPPAALIWSTIIVAVLLSGSPREEAFPVTEKMPPIRMGFFSAARANETTDRRKITAIVTAKKVRAFIFFSLFFW
jgi:hypothetical protein